MPQEMCFKAVSAAEHHHDEECCGAGDECRQAEIEAKRRSDEQQDSRKNYRDPDDHASAAERRHMRTHLCRFTKMPALRPSQDGVSRRDGNQCRQSEARGKKKRCGRAGRGSHCRSGGIWPSNTTRFAGLEIGSTKLAALAMNA